MTDNCLLMKLSAGEYPRAITFSADGKHVFKSGPSGVEVCRVQDGQLVATLKARNAKVLCLAVSKNGRWIAGGTFYGYVVVWDAESYETVWEQREDIWSIRAVDFSTDSTQLISGSENCTATIWDLAGQIKIRTLNHEKPVIAAKYSARSNRIATATWNGSVQIWDNDDGSLLPLIDVPVPIIPAYNSGLVWFYHNILLVSDKTIKQLDVSTGSIVLEWPVRINNHASCITLSKNGQFIAYSASREIALWDPSTTGHLNFIGHPQDISSIALSPCDRFLAISGKDSEIVVKNLSRFLEPDIQINNTVLDAWKRGELKNADTFISTAIHQSQDQNHHLLAARALIRARSQLWDDALVDAEKAIGIQQSVIAYIAKSIAYVGQGDRSRAYRACDIAFERFPSSHVTLLLLIKAIVVFMAGEHCDAISRMNNLTATVPFVSACYTVQAYMYLIQGDILLERNDYLSAIQSFEHARKRLRDSREPLPLVVSLMSGWNSDDLHLTVRQRLCEVLYITGRSREAGECLLDLVNTFDAELYTSTQITKWVSEFSQRCLSVTENAGDDGTIISSTPLLRVWAKSSLFCSTWNDALVAAANFHIPKATIYCTICERLEMTGRETDAVTCFLEMVNDLADGVYINRQATVWVREFTQRRLSVPPTLHIEPMALLGQWTKAELTRNLWKEVLLSATGLTLPRVAVYRALCERLNGDMHLPIDAVECFKQMMNELGGEVSIHDSDWQWTCEFRQHLVQRLEDCGDAAVSAKRHDEAINYYTTALSLNTVTAASRDGLLKRSKAYLAAGAWEKALDDANRVIELDPQSPWGYEIKHAALHKAGDYNNALAAFETMLYTMKESPDPAIRRQASKYIAPSSIREAIRKIVPKVTRHLPRVLINVATGCLCDRAAQASLFESSSICKGLVSSMTTRKNNSRIKREVRRYVQYVMLSHKWEPGEPLFHHVINTTVYDLVELPTHAKLRSFCGVVRDCGFIWAWSDTCCINKSDNSVLQEALVAMFKWYEGCAMMIVFLKGVNSSSQLGALRRSIWNTRGWTLPEYIAAKVIRFYTEEWTPYLRLEIPNHKESQEIISEMEQATGIFAELLLSLRPGFSRIREKLRLASTRETTRIEDAAYSLFGIFSVSGLPAIYGEGDASLGRLLSYVLAGSGDISILAWTGESGSHNSCLPARITVFNELPTSYLPAHIPDAEMITMSYPSLDLQMATRLYDRLSELSSPPWFSGKRMKLPCIAFPLPSFSRRRTQTSSRSGRIYSADTLAFGPLQIKTKHELSRMTLYLIHPWLDALLEPGDKRNINAEEDGVLLPSPTTSDSEEFSDDEDIVDEEDDESEPDDDPDVVSVSGFEQSPPSAHPPLDKEIRARRMVAHLKQPFGALLFALTSTGARTDYTRVAADCLIRVQLQENVSLQDILENVRTLDVL